MSTCDGINHHWTQWTPVNEDLEACRSRGCECGYRETELHQWQGVEFAPYAHAFVSVPDDRAQFFICKVCKARKSRLDSGEMILL